MCPDPRRWVRKGLLIIAAATALAAGACNYPPGTPAVGTSPSPPPAQKSSSPPPTVTAPAHAPSGSDLPTPQEVTPTLATVGEVRLGAVLPVSGSEAIAGGHFRSAIEFLVREVNARGGVRLSGGLAPIKLTILDDASDPERSGRLVGDLITGHGVHALVGGYSSNLVQAQVPVSERLGIPYVSGGGAASALYGKGRWVFGILSPVEYLGRSQLEYLKDLMDRGRLSKPATIALAWEQTDHGRDYRKGVVDTVRAYSDYFQVVLDESFPLFAADFSALLAKVRNAGADILMVDSHLEDYISMHRQYIRLGLYHKMVTYGARGTDKAARDGLGAATDYLFSGVWTSPQLPYPQVRDFVDRYTRSANRQPEWYHMVAYESARVLVAAIEEAGSLEPERIRAALSGGEVQDALTPGGVLKFTAAGYAVYPYVIVQNKPGGRAEVVWPTDAKTGESVAPIPRS